MGKQELDAERLKPVLLEPLEPLEDDDVFVNDMGKQKLDAKRLKPVLLEVLEEEDVRKLLRKILGLDARAPLPERPDDGKRRELERKDRELDEYRSKLERAGRDVEALRAQLTQRDRDQASLQRRLETSLNECTRLQSECNILKNRSLLPPAHARLLARVREDEELIHRFELNNRQDDLDLLLQAVAVLSHEGNLRRLWDLYKGRCESQRAALSPADEGLLEAALGWHNVNGADSPYQLERPATGSAYNYEKHMRPTLGMGGETIQAVWLPGIPGLNLKPLVATE